MPTAIRTCPLCEATCGLELEVSDDGQVGRIRGDAQDVLSHGFLCPKGVALRELHHDPDRVREPLVRRDGELVPVSWDEAFAEVARLLGPILADGDRRALAAYLGNPFAHGLSGMLYGRVLLKALGSPNVFSASTVDQYPKQVAAGWMFGSAVSVPVPDLDRTDLLLILGANPLASNGSLMTAPDVRGRLRAIQDRGGRVVVVDPRRTRTAQVASQHVPIRPGTDALLLLSLLHVIFAEGLDAPLDGELFGGLDEVRALAAGFAPEVTAPATRVPAETAAGLARELAAAPRAAVYGRMGTTTQRFGAVTSWLVDVLNAVTGNLDRPGGAMWTLPAAGSPTTRGEPGRGRGMRPPRFASRVRGLPEVLGELPVAALAEEIDTPGDGRVRALITLAGNPAVSTPNAGRLAAALEGLDALICIDLYVNETTRHADVLLPAPSPLERPHFDVLLLNFAVRDVANFSPPVLPRPAGMPDEWEVLLRVAAIVLGQPHDADPAGIDRLVALEAARREAPDLDPEAVLDVLAPRVGPERLLDLLLRTGPYGAGFPELDAPGRGADREDGGLTLALLEAHPHGIDLGALKPRLPEVLRTPDGRVDLAPAPLLRAAEGLGALVGEAGDLVLVGRRHLRSNNSWMHNLPLLAGGPERCTLQVHPDDAARLGVADGATVRVASRVGAVEVAAEVTDEVLAGVVCLPHGWGHDAPGARLEVAARRPGVNSNVLTDETLLEGLTGTAVLNGIPVTVTPVSSAPRADEPARAVSA
jgi:anaerobic selenocysteine-containing dehydrogenase